MYSILPCCAVDFCALQWEGGAAVFLVCSIVEQCKGQQVSGRCESQTRIHTHFLSLLLEGRIVSSELPDICRLSHDDIRSNSFPSCLHEDNCKDIWARLHCYLIRMLFYPCQLAYRPFELFLQHFAFLATFLYISCNRVKTDVGLHCSLSMYNIFIKPNKYSNSKIGRAHV